MDTSATVETQVNLDHLTRQLHLPADSVRQVIELLDDGNTIPFITRYRKDRTGGLDEQAILAIRDAVEKQRQLSQRKETILKSIKSREKLTDELAQRIRTADSAKLLEDLYLPYKPKKRTLATLARERGLEPLAGEVLHAAAAAADLQQRAADLVDPEKQLNSVAEVLAGVGHVLAERFSERADLRGKLRGIMWRTGRIRTSQFVAPDSSDRAATPAGGAPEPSTPAATTEVTQDSAGTIAARPAGAGGDSATAPCPAQPESDAALSENNQPDVGPTPEVPAEDESPQSIPLPLSASPNGDTTGPVEAAATDGEGVTADATDGQPDSTGSQPGATDGEPGTAGGEIAPTAHHAIAMGRVNPSGENAADDSSGPWPTEPASSELSADESRTGERASSAPGTEGPSSGNVTSETPPVAVEAHGEADQQDGSPAEESPGTEPAADAPARPLVVNKVLVAASRLTLAERRRQQRKEARQRKRRKLEQAFKDYFQYEESLSRVPPHRVLAINRGERSRVLRVQIEADVERMHREAERLLIPTDHPHAALLRDCLRDALHRLLLPSLEREIRRELTQRAEDHAISVFARNLRKLLLQPPVHGRRVVAVDPGFRNGCKLTALDQFGNVLDHGVIYVIGKEQRRVEARAGLAEMIRKHQLRVIAIGNGTGCRETEQLVAEMIANELSDLDVSYVVVNEAGASVYSTSELGREELPDYDATLRGAISIGRRLLDPLSELVKINPSNIGVGLYQHDVKSKPLQASLDSVVQSCVNYVGVDVNSASPALLSYVSGLNQLTARRLYEYRREHGPFTSRQQLKQVPGIGEATFVQAAGFLKIMDGENPLDATWIHPESYEAAQRVLAAIDSDLSELASRLPRPPLPAEPPPSESDRGERGTESERAGTASGPDGTETAAEPTGIETPAGPDDVGVTVKPGAHETAAASEIGDGATASDDAANEPTATLTTADRPSPSLAERARQVDVDALCQQLGIGRLLLQDILSDLSRPGRDPRDDLPAPMFRRGILKLEDLQPGMELCGTVVNVVDFGAFVDIGLSDTGLVHISRLADRYVQDPHEVVSVGDVMSLWVVGVDRERRRVSLSAIKPGTETPRKPHRRGDARKNSSAPPARGGRQPRQRGTKHHAAAGRDRSKRSRVSRPPRKPKPVVPITKEMKEGKEPMRTFSDLKQFYEKRTDPPSQEDQGSES